MTGYRRKYNDDFFNVSMVKLTLQTLVKALLQSYQLNVKSSEISFLNFILSHFPYFFFPSQKY